MAATIASNISRLDWIASITIILIAVDFASRIITNQFTQPVYWDTLVTISVGYWFGKK